MKKTLKIIFNKGTIVINQDEKQKLEIQKNPTKISGEQLYDFFFSDLTENEEIIFDINNSQDLSKDDKVIFNRFKELIDDICKAINSAVIKTENSPTGPLNIQH